LEQASYYSCILEDLQKALSYDEVERRRLSKALLPHVRRFTRAISTRQPADAERTLLREIDMA
jgi:hypothetical protein